ncbi:MAG TPA: tetratricopeptide repeat protein [Thermoanaerobaculia bacterium]|nr:tetratricopeptide repeat protein [Thermoanaerobaculia bacterium]
MRRLSLLLLLAAALSASAADLGSVAFPTSAKNPQAQALFERGVAALHSFWYEEAADAFRKARELEPSFAMAYWGEAMTHNHPIWMEQDRAAAREILMALPKDAGDAKEREWLATLDVLYGDGDKHSRDIAYQEAMRALAGRYPDDLEVQAFHALSILGTMSRGADDARRQVAAAAILEPLLPRAPEHPGVLHYMIHAYDDPLHAPLGLRAARRYARVAPAAHHALHMPSHIFLQLGMWDEAAASNEQSYAASKAWVERAKLPSSKRDLHSLTWLHYIYLQQGRRDDAMRLLQEVDSPLSERERSTRARMLAAWAVETGEAVEEATGSDEKDAHCAAGYATSNDAALYARALTAIRRKDFRAAGKAIASLKGNITSDVMALTLRALLEQKRGRLSKAIKLAEEAVAREAMLGAPSGPPDVLKPAHELYGELLSAAGRCDEAREQFRLSLLRTPNRRLSANPPPCEQ